MIRFQHGGAYSSDINALRDQIRANGTHLNIQAIQLQHPLQPAANLSVHINLAYQPNGALVPANASLYTVGIGNPHGIWHFTIAGLGALPGAAFPGANDGSYGALGYPHAPLPAITDANLANAIAALSGYAGTPLNPGLSDNLVRVIVAVSESVRFSEVRAGVESVLTNPAATYVPNLATLHAWGGHTLGN